MDTEKVSEWGVWVITELENMVYNDLELQELYKFMREQTLQIKEAIEQEEKSVLSHHILTMDKAIQDSENTGATITDLHDLLVFNSQKLKELDL